MAWQFGPYRVEGLIARGGMGEVHRAYDTQHDRIVALKVLGEHLAADHDFRERFKREAHMVARLREPHVIPIHAYGEIDGRLYLDMRLVDGEDVAAVLGRSGPMSPADAVDVIGQVAQALDAAHAEGLVHRDVKPSNIIIGPRGFAYLVDFGIARSVDASTGLTGSGGLVGTLDYMAPERFESGPVDHRVDVYALACVLHQCLTGTKPFPAEITAALVYAHLNHEPPRPSLRAGVPAALDQVIARGMAKDPNARFPSAGDLALAARQALTGSIPAVAEQPATKVTPEPHRQRRVRWWHVAVPSVVAAALAGVVVAVLLRPDEVKPVDQAVAGVTTAQTVTPESTGVTSAPRTPVADLRLSKPLSTPPCDGGYIVIVASAVSPGRYASEVQQFLNANPGAGYLHAPSTGCGSLRTHVDGAEIYVVFHGVFKRKDAACARRAAVGGDAYVRQLNNSAAPDRVVACG